MSGNAPPPAGDTSAGKALALWIAKLLLSLLQVPNPPDKLTSAIAMFLGRFGWLLAFGALVPVLCAFVLGLLDKAGARSWADHYRDYVVSGFSINESIYRSDKERIDYLLQMRRVNFFEDDAAGGDPAVVLSIIPGQQGRIVIERASLIQRVSTAGSGGGGTQSGASRAAAAACPNQPSPVLRTVSLLVRDTRHDEDKATFTVNSGVPFEFDADFWKKMKLDDGSADSVRSLRLSVLPTDPSRTRACFDLLVDFRIEMFKTRSRA